MDYIKSFVTIATPEKSFSEQITGYIVENPTIIIKGIPVILVGWYSIPLLISLGYWAPWIYVGYELYQKTSVAKQAYTIAKTTKEFIFG